MRESVVFYSSFEDAISLLPENEQLAAYKTIIHYAFTGEEIACSNLAKVVFTMAKPQIDANNKRANNAQKGGRPKEEKPMVSEKSKNEKPNVNKNENENNNESKETPLKGSKEKRAHGQLKNVLLTDTEYETLHKDFANADEAIDYFSAYIAEKGDQKSKSHYLSIRRWVFDALAEREQRRLKLVAGNRASPPGETDRFMESLRRIGNGEC